MIVKHLERLNGVGNRNFSKIGWRLGHKDTISNSKIDMYTKVSIGVSNLWPACPLCSDRGRFSKIMYTKNVYKNNIQ